MRSIRRAIFALVALACGFSAAAQTSAYPSKPVHVIVPLPPGADTDAMARLQAAWLERRFAQSFIVENRPGGNQIIGVEGVLKSPPDGYTLLFTASTLAFRPAVVKATPFDPLKDLRAIAPVAGNGYVLVANPGVPAKTPAEFIAYAKANGGRVNYATIGTFPVPEMAQLAAKFDLRWTMVPYQGGAQAYNAIIAGDAQFGVGSPFQSIGFADSGKLRIIAYTGARRHPRLSSVPTLAETVSSDMVGGPWFGLFGAAAIPADIVNRINGEAREMAKDPEFRARLDKMGYADVYSFTAAEAQRFYEQTGTSANDVYRRLGITPE
jgi:tripartite-type tricarboxylate transporter receptor subunit TctC